MSYIEENRKLFSFDIKNVKSNWLITGYYT